MRELAEISKRKRRERFAAARSAERFTPPVCGERELAAEKEKTTDNDRARTTKRIALASVDSHSKGAKVFHGHLHWKREDTATTKLSEVLRLSKEGFDACHDVNTRKRLIGCVATSFSTPQLIQHFNTTNYMVRLAFFWCI
ncbi:MAG: hypothetical protein GY852_03565 [bacterium]|nr:hypothetical protein [bacterium]